VFYVHNSTYAFSAILSVYLLGLGGGAAVGSRLSAGRHAAPWLVGTLCVIPIACLASIAVYRALPALAQSLLGETLDPDLSGFPDTDFRVVRSWSTAMAAIFLQVGAVLLIPAFLFGLVFPL